MMNTDVYFEIYFLRYRTVRAYNNYAFVSKFFRNCPCLTSYQVISLANHTRKQFPRIVSIDFNHDVGVFDMSLPDEELPRRRPWRIYGGSSSPAKSFLAGC